ncbi:MAG: NYN domain-containing protein [Pseudomonadota bacterium]|nr:NYN domain-containing protein [Pseudomonadota bacterium]
MHTPGPAPVALFVDAENVSWCDGAKLDALVARASAHGPLLVRRAYANWSQPGMHRIQAELSRLGFDLVQVFHPVARKNSADIHMTVDAVELLALEPTIQWFYLVTGDSDFAPLFRRLRERAKWVVGCGPRSKLSDSVRTSCTAYVYPEDLRTGGKAPGVALRAVPKAPAVPMAPPVAMTPPVAMAPPVAMTPPVPKAPAVAMPPAVPTARAVPTPPPPPRADDTPPADSTPLPSAYQRLLRKQGWSSVAFPDLVAMHAALFDAPSPFTRDTGLSFGVVVLGEERITPARKAWSLLRKVGVVQCVAPSTEADSLFAMYGPADMGGLLDLVDTHLLARIGRAAAAGAFPYDLDAVRPLLYGASDDARVARIEADALRLEFERPELERPELERPATAAAK